MQFLVKCQADYSDEFDVYGFKVMSDEQWIILQENIKKCNYPMEVYFGTNEALIFESPNEIMRSLTAIEMTPEEVEVLKKGFGTSYDNSINYGAGIIDNIIDHAAGAYD